MVIHRSYKNVGTDRSNDIALVLLDRPSSKPVIQLPAGRPAGAAWGPGSCAVRPPTGLGPGARLAGLYAASCCLWQC